ncbi:NAD(P)-dependent oxidoreductase [Ignavibacterium sp.]|uniref:SDR family oxidoreductase n=1 Tax=Ignavibacterium sp. TaxID=2651167 RepID=UPI00307F011A
MKILVTGGSGLLGQYLNIFLSKENEILSTYNRNIGNCGQYNSAKVDIRDSDALLRVFKSFSPEIVIHTAAISDTIVNSEISPKDVYDVNVNATFYIVKLCREFNAKLIYTSTDLVYAGYRGSYLKEDAKLIPLSLYAETKLMGEVKIQEALDDYIILRTALLFGFGLNHSRCHFQFLFKQLSKNIPVKVFIDQYRSPLSLFEAAKLISEMVKKDLHNEIINFGGPERVSRYELAERLCELKGFNKNLLIKVKLDDMPELPKVEDVSMNIEKMKSFGLVPKPLNEMIKNVIDKAY